MKSILIIDSPENCYDCSLRHWYSCCGERMKVLPSNLIKPSWCPLKPIPERKSGSRLPEFDTDIHYEIGWNACIDEITKGG